jgi:mannose-6-phosphate isomerase-like protein (cupin superfamily)
MGRAIGWKELGGSGPTRFLFRGAEHGAEVCVFVVDFSPGDGPRRHRHPYEEVFVVHEGRAAFTVEEETLEATVGQVVVVPSGTSHTFVNTGGDRLRLMSIHPRPQIEVDWLED